MSSYSEHAQSPDIWQRYAAAYPLDRQGRMQYDDLAALRKALPQTNLVQRHVGKFLQFANALLADAEARAGGAPAMAEAGFAGQVHYFKRQSQGERQ